MKVRATVTKGQFEAGKEYDLPEKEAMAMIIAGAAEPIVTVIPAFEREKAIHTQSRWLTR